MRLGTIATVFGLALVCLAASQPARAETGLDPDTTDCIRSNAAKVSATIPDLDKAVTFLVEKVCAEPLAYANAARIKARQEVLAQNLQTLCADADKPITPKTGSDADTRQTKDTTNYLCRLRQTNAFRTPDDAPPTLVGAPPAAAISLAARLLIDIRASHSNPDRQR